MPSHIAPSFASSTASRRIRSALAKLGPLVLGAGLLTALALSGALAQFPVVEMRDLAPGRLRTDAFELPTARTIRIDAIGAAPTSGEGSTAAWLQRTLKTNGITDGDDRKAWQGNAWILDSRTRRVVWELRTADARRERRDLRSFNGGVRLQAGTYEAMFAAYPANWHPPSNAGNDDEERTPDDALTRNFRFVIQAGDDARHVGRTDLDRARSEFTDAAVVSLTGIGHASNERMGFKLERPTEVEIYAIGEERKDGNFDYGWILNADTHEKVWEMTYGLSDPAGGAEKNRFARRTLTLPAGRYAAIYASDESHDPSSWNSAPPYDPAFYGMTIRVTRPSDKSRVSTFAYDPWPSGTPVVALTKLVDHDMRSAGFSLSRPTSVRIYAIGEGTEENMVDFGWIIDASTRKRVWSMSYRDTEHAGGADKNRLVDRVIRLDRGNYLVYFTTDGSHSYEEWNAAPPLDEMHWGISIYPATETDRVALQSYREARDAAVIAQLIKVGDDADARARFTLDRATEVRVYAIGEGRDDDMFDYAWIENARTRERVWEMRYDETEHAGGANKNRQANAVLRLGAGEYILHYRSDDSHSYGDWNAAAPFDPAHWGVTVYRVPQ
jgi:hypothetical protein